MQSLRQGGYQFELSEAVIMCLESTAEDEEHAISSEYENCIEILGNDDSLPRKVSVLLDAIADSIWIRAKPKKGIERSIVESQDDRSNGEIDSLLRLGSVKVLLGEEGDETKGGERSRNGRLKKPMTTTHKWKHLVFAASWKRAEMRAMAERFHLKCEIVKILRSVKEYTEGNKSSQEALKQLASLCLAGLKEVGSSDLAAMEQTCTNLEERVQERKKQMKNDGNDEDDDEAGQREKGLLKKHIEACSLLLQDMANRVKVVEMLLL
ncbi:hypothetical protein CBS101457_001383 [Exobasidium rhododendri]|nr:hypothetical protein CBS101457_001383 [Exobasidium rhododendri]